MIMFFNMFKDFKFDGPTLHGLGFHAALNLQFFENERLKIDEKTVNTLTAILQNLKPGDKPNNISQLDAFLASIQSIYMAQENNRVDLSQMAGQFEILIKGLPNTPPPPPAPVQAKNPTQAAKKEGEKNVPLDQSKVEIQAF